MAESASCDHKWREYTEEEMAALRSQARQGRPSGAWVEGGEQCESCGAIQVKVSWWGQVHTVPFAPKQEGGQPVVHWPTRSGPAPSGGGPGMQSM